MSEKVDLKDLQLNHQDRVVAKPYRSSPMKWIFLLLLIAALAWIGYRETNGKTNSGIAVTTEKVATWRTGAKHGPAAFSATGWVKLPNYHPVTVTPLTTGRLESLTLVEGDKVEKGQVIARLYAKDYEDLLAAAKAGLELSQAELERFTTGFRPQEVAQAKAEVKSLAAAALTAANTFHRSSELQPTGAVSMEKLQQDEATAAKAQGLLTQAKEKLSLLTEGYRREEIAAARARVAQAKAKVALAVSQVAYTRVRAPIAGVVLERLAQEGQWVKSGAGLVNLYNPADLEAQIDVNQENLASLFLGQQVDLTTRAEQGRTFSAKVVLLEPLADRVKNILQVKVKIANPQAGILYPGMVVQARFRSRVNKNSTAKTTKPTLTIPAAAVVHQEDKTFVFLVMDGKARRKEISLGKLDAGRYPVKQGLQPGNTIITGGTEFLTDGTNVRPGQTER